MTADSNELDLLFAEAREATRPSDDLVARVLADAAREQAALSKPPATQQRSATARGWFSALGGWFGASGLVAATMAGLLVGVYAPDSIDSVLGGQLSSYGLVTQGDLLPGLTDLLSVDGN